MKICKPALTQPGGHPDLRLPGSRNVIKPFFGQPPSLCHFVMSAVDLENTFLPALLWPHVEANILASQPSPFFTCVPTSSLWWPFEYWNKITEHLHSEPFLALCVLWRKSQSHHLALQSLLGPVLLTCHLPPVFIPAPLIPGSSFLVGQVDSSEVSPRPLSPVEMGISPWLKSYFCHLSLHQPHLPNHAINGNSLYPCAQQNCFIFSHLLII